MDRQQAVDALNEAIRYEHAAVLQYQHYALVVRGLWRSALSTFFASKSTEAHGHAARFGQKVVALGGVPTLDVADVVESTDVPVMLAQVLKLERSALAAYERALVVAAGDTALRNMLEDQIEAEQGDVEELELMLDEVAAAGVTPLSSAKRARG